MVKIDREKSDELYEELMEIFKKYKDNPTFSYEKHQHHLYEESEHPGISKYYYNEVGSVEFTNMNGDIIVFEISRFHNHQHNGCSGLCSAPCRDIVISKKVGEEKEILWSMKIVCGTLYYSGEVTSFNIPYDLLKEYIENKQDELVTSSSDNLRESNTEVERVDLDGELTKVMSEYDFYLKQRKQLIEEMEKKIEVAVNSIREDYSSRIDECSKNIDLRNDRVERLKNIINNYSVFDTKMLGCAISELISTIECSDFFYNNVTCKCIKRVHGVMDSWDEPYDKSLSIVSPNKNISSIDEKDLESDDIILIDGKSVDSISSDKFPYIKEFIEYIIKYRMDNGLDDFSQDDMILLVQRFLESYQDKILENYKAKIKMKIGNIKL